MLWIIRLNDIRQRPSISLLKRFVNYILVSCYTDPTKPLYAYGTNGLYNSASAETLYLRLRYLKRQRGRLLKILFL